MPLTVIDNASVTEGILTVIISDKVPEFIDNLEKIKMFGIMAPSLEPYHPR